MIQGLENLTVLAAHIAVMGAEEIAPHGPDKDTIAMLIPATSSENLRSAAAELLLSGMSIAAEIAIRIVGLERSLGRRSRHTEQLQEEWTAVAQSARSAAERIHDRRSVNNL